MKILFVMRSSIYVRNFESTIRMLAQRGHHVHLVTEIHPVLDATDIVTRLMAEHPQITHSPPPAVPVDGWSLLGEKLRRGVDYLRYQRPEYRGAPKLRRRADRYAPPFVVRATHRPLGRSAMGLWLTGALLRFVEGTFPTPGAVVDFVRAQQPDLVIVTPLVEPGSPQSPYLRAARALGIPAALCVYSWDNLTNKGLIQGPLDLVTVWNEPMRREAVELHGVPPAHVAVTGAPGYDHWFAWKPRSTREEFCRRVGLPPDRPYVLYLCSSKFIAPREVGFVRRWIEQIRAASPVLARTGILIRPHPQWLTPWKAVDFSGVDAVAVWPRDGANPMDLDSRSDYFDSMFHSAAVVGVNTSAQIESAIVGRGVYTLLAPEFRDTQEGTLHFHHLHSVNGGMLHVAKTIDEHVAQLEQAIANNGADDGRCRRFVEAFVRPLGFDVPSTSNVVAALEALAARPRGRPARPAWYAGFVRARVRRFTIPLMHEYALAQKAAQDRLQKLAQSERRGAERLAALGNRRRALEADPALREQVVATFHDVRERVLRMKAVGGIATSVAELKPLWNATPDMLVRLRHFGGCVGGARPDDYADVPDTALRQLRSHLRRLRQEAGDDLGVQEAPMLGQFGVLRGDGVYTADTLMYYEILAALKFAALLDLFRAPHQRPVVWEIGRDWGGFAYQFKTLFPDVTYVVSSHPDRFLLSASYLRILFPGARVRFWGDRPDGEMWRDLNDLDFVFVPDDVGRVTPPAAVTLALDLMALEHMFPDAAASHVHSAADAGARYFYSAAPVDVAAGSADVRAMLARRYWLHDLPVPQFDKRPALEPWTPRDPAGPRSVRRSHVMGWKRLGG